MANPQLVGLKWKIPIKMDDLGLPMATPISRKPPNDVFYLDVEIATRRGLGKKRSGSQKCCKCLIGYLDIPNISKYQSL